MKTLNKFALAAAVSAGLLGATGVMAAVQGEVKPTFSFGNFDILFSNDAEVRIWGLKDMSFTGDITAVQSETVSFCTYNNSTDHVVITASSLNTDFALNTEQGVSGGAVPYNLRISDKDTPATTDVWGAGKLTSGAQGYYQYDAATSDTNNLSHEGDFCGGDFQQTNVTVTIPGVSGAFTDGSYADTVTLEVRPI